MGWASDPALQVHYVLCISDTQYTRSAPANRDTEVCVSSVSSYKEYRICVSTKLTTTLQNVTFIKYGQMEYTALVCIHFISNTFSLLIKHLNNWIVSSDWSLGLCYWGLK